MITAFSFIETVGGVELSMSMKGPPGPMPDHQWDGSQLRFVKPDRTWGSYVNLLGPAPAHEWDGTSLKFRNPDDTWGNAVDLKGETGGVGPSGADGADGADGEDGEDGMAATIAIGTVTTLPAGSPATVTNSGTENAAVLNFGVPEGQPGADGKDGEGSGDVSGPSSATDGHLVLFDGATGKLIKEGGAPFSGSYNDLDDKPSIPAAPVNADWDATSGLEEIKNKPTLGSAAALDVGTSANKIVQLDGSGKLPALDGSQLTNLPGGTVPAAGAIGSHVIAASTGLANGNDYAVGTTVSGSSLVVSNNSPGANSSTSLSARSSTYMAALPANVTSLGYTGTWRLLARVALNSTAAEYPIALFVRIA